MKIYNSYKNYEEYVAIQKTHVHNHCKKLKQNKIGKEDYDKLGWVQTKYLDRICTKISQYITLDEIDFIICHGVRCGYESKYFMDKFGVDKVYSTDLSEEAFVYDKRHFHVQDFDVTPTEWIGKFDLLYSNVIDHSRKPDVTLTNWEEQLTDKGIMVVTFSWGTRVTNCDCFALTPHGGKKTKGKYNYLIELKNFIKSSNINLEILYGSPPYEGVRVADVILRKGTL